jgi:aminoglycoside phosphotransferase family enzyme
LEKSNQELLDQSEVIAALKKPKAYQHNPNRIDLIQTHISFIFIADQFVYKIKKAVNFGFLDFETLTKRKEFCKKELEINKILCKDMYLEVVPINKSKIIAIKGKGNTIEFAVKMKNIPQEKLMNKLLEKNRINKKIIEEISRKIANFHTNNESKYDSSKSDLNVNLDPIVEINWKENFDQTKPFIGVTISSEEFSLIKKRINYFIKNNNYLFKKRMQNGKVRFCHGDIHSGNIFVADKIYIFDAIEFNDRLRCSDVAADIGFLAMDLEFKNKPELAKLLVERYIEYSKDLEIGDVLAFYKCYRAYVRGKVISFKLNDPNIDNREKEQAKIEAKRYFKLARKYTKQVI